MSDCTVRFFHYQINLTSKMLREYGMDYLHKNEVQKRLLDYIGYRSKNSWHRIQPIVDETMTFEKEQIFCANEVFPESALADPIADLDVWSEWQSGVRRFPHPGRYPRLSIGKQEGKAAPPTSIAVIGEIFTGLFAQCVVAPLVTVRPVRRWPDFIFYRKDRELGFLVESKASADLDIRRLKGLHGIKRTELGDGLIQAIKNLNADPFVQIWLSFTNVESVSPLKLEVCFIEINASDDHREGRDFVVPDMVYNGWTEQLLSLALAELEKEREGEDDDEKDEEGEEDDIAWSDVVACAKEQVEEFASTAIFESRQATVIENLSMHLDRETPREILSSSEGPRWIKAKELASRGVIAELRETAKGKHLMLADLPTVDLLKLRNSWQSDWRLANQPWKRLNGLDLWRCSSAVIALGSKEHVGARVANAVFAQGSE